MQQPNKPGAFTGDVFYGDPDDTTKGTHCWDGTRWVKMAPADEDELDRDVARSMAETDPAPQPPESILQFFAFEHLPPHLQTVSQNFHALAQHIVDNLPRNPERTVALRKLLEAKDAAVRAKLFKES